MSIRWKEQIALTIKVKVGAIASQYGKGIKEGKEETAIDAYKTIMKNDKATPPLFSDDFRAGSLLCNRTSRYNGEFCAVRRESRLPIHLTALLATNRNNIFAGDEVKNAKK